MHFDRRFAIVAAFSVVWGLLVSLLFYRTAVAGRKAGPEKMLVVAAQPLPPGAPIAAESLKTVRVPENLFPKGGYSRLEDVAGRPAVTSIQPDEPVVESRIAPKGSGFGVAPLIPPGMRALSVRVNDLVGVAGFVLPGMRVDVLVTGRPPGADDTATTTVLQNVVVLSAGQAVEADARSQSMSVPVVTLLVTPAQAESLALANIEGHIQLVLRNSTDQVFAQTSGQALRGLYGRAEAAPVKPLLTPSPKPVIPIPPAKPAVIPPPPPTVETMLLIQGSKKAIETFPPYAQALACAPHCPGN